MSAKKNIDRLFQEKFKDFEIAPNDAVWDRISESLPKKKKKRRVIALWWQVGGVAAAIVLLFTVGISVFDTENSSANKPVIVDSKDSNESNSTEEQPPNIKPNELNDNIKSKFEKLEYVETDKNNDASEEDNNSGSLSNKNDKAKSLTLPNHSQKNGIANNNNKEQRNNSNLKKQKSLINTNNDKDTKVANNSKSELEKSKNELLPKSELKSVIKESIKDPKTAVTDKSTSKNSEDNPNTFNSDTNTDNSNSNKEETTLLNELNKEKESINNAIATQENITEKEEDDEQSRWSITPNVAPVYFSSLGQGSSLDSQFNENAKSSDINMSYGITGTYAISRKVKIRAGVNRVNLSQTTSNVFAFTGEEFSARGVGNLTAPNTTNNNANNLSSGNIDNNGTNVLLMSANMLDNNTTPEIFNSKAAGNIDQRLGFIEVPLEVEYRLLDKKFGVNVIGGFSTFFLNQNEIYADVDGSSTLIGEASNINSTSFSANFGLGLDYELSKQWNINLEPQFKYQINTFNNTSGNFSPFIVGVYTGLSFKF